jgi:hypothetical protein
LDTFVGFWPAREQFGEFEPMVLDPSGLPDSDTQTRCATTLLDFSGDGWKIRVCADYLVLLHLADLEPSLRAERTQSKDIANFSMGATRAAWPKYVESLNAIYFLLFASCHTGRNDYMLQDFAEISFWHCARLQYDKHDTPIKHANYGRTSGAFLRRFGERTYKKPQSLTQIKHEIFKDAALYWSVVYELGLVSMAALGAKIISEHRLGNYQASIVLAWFELERWIIETASTLGLRTTKFRKTGKVKTDNVNEILKRFPDGTTVKVNFTDIDKLREIRNDIAHKDLNPTIQDSALAIRCFFYVFKMRSGLVLKVDEGPPPTFGLQ